MVMLTITEQGAAKSAVDGTAYVALTGLVELNEPTHRRLACEWVNHLHKMVCKEDASHARHPPPKPAPKSQPHPKGVGGSWQAPHRNQTELIASTVSRTSGCATTTNGFKDERCLPSFLLIGAQKSGTSTLSSLMAQHPQIKHPDQKELLYFYADASAVELAKFKRLPLGGRCKAPSLDSAKSYLGRFPTISNSDFVEHGFVTGEWSATYLPCLCCASTVHQMMPSAKIIAILRHPIDRAFSRYNEQKAFLQAQSLSSDGLDGFEKPWGAFVQHAIAEIKNCQEVKPSEYTQETNDIKCKFARTGAYSAVGYSRYGPQLRAWLKKYGVKLLVLYMDDLEENPLGMMRRIENHVGLGAYLDYQHASSIYNSKGHYGWHKRVDSSRRRLGVIISVEDAANYHCMDVAPFKTLLNFYRPSINSMVELASEHKIAPLPSAWLKEWGIGTNENQSTISPPLPVPNNTASAAHVPCNKEH
jgi:hypothetical protein